MISKDATLFVTGASGFVASQLVRLLLEQGYRVRGSVRDPDKAKELGALPGASGPGGRLELVKADLLTPGAFDAPLQGCAGVMHTASPYVLTVKDAQKELVEPAEQGTLNVLRAAQKAGVKRVVLTSSMAAVTDEPEKDKILSEKDWNTKSSLTRNPYYFSKVRGERVAWELMEKERPRFDLVVINPFLVVGPSLVSSVNTSNQIFVDMITGKYPGCVALAWGIVDVRDVALAHLLAMTTPRAKGRYVCAAGTMSMREVVDVLVAKGYGDKFPNLGKLARRHLDGALGSLLVRLGSFTQPKGARSYLKTNLGRVPRFDNAKIKAELGMTFRPLPQTLADTVDDLARWGHVTPRDAPRVGAAS